jgi:hypothetical protein
MGACKDFSSEEFAANGVVNPEANERFSFNEVMAVKTSN